MSKPVYCLGINFSHDRAAVLLRDGRPIVGIAEERLDRNKHSIVADENQTYLRLAPMRAIQYCLDDAGIGFEDLSQVAACGSVVYHANRLLRNLTLDEVREQLPQVPPDRISIVNHHLAHAGSAFFSSGFDEAAVLVVDGAGNLLGNRPHGLFRIPDVEHTSGYNAKQNRIEPVFKIAAGKKAMNSLGALYSLVTRFTGFDSMEEGKTMGLAPYGKGTYLRLFESAIKGEGAGYRIHPDFQPHDRLGRFYPAGFLRKFGPPDAKRTLSDDQKRDMCFAVQKVLEDRMVSLAVDLKKQTGQKRLCLAGGVGLNCVANSRIVKEAGFDEVFFVPCMADDGTALGAALWAWRTRLNNPSSYTMTHPFLGRTYGYDEIASAIAKQGDLLFVTTPENPAKAAAKLLADGKILGWFQGGSEIGPRALGHRCILCDPTRADAKDILNKKVKHREPFRPFAPAVLESRVNDFFDLDRPSPFMLMTAKTLDPNRLPAVTHVDGTARVQTVSRVPGFLRFADLIEQFGQITGTPVLLSTSLNVAGEPIVETPDEAIRCLLETRLDGLVIEGQIVTKTNPKLSQQIADLTREKAEQAQTTKRMELELESIRGSRGWRLLTWFNRVFRPWQRPRKPNIL